jgi:hypothetical protein
VTKQFHGEISPAVCRPLNNSEASIFPLSQNPANNLLNDFKSLLVYIVRKLDMRIFKSQRSI